MRRVRRAKREVARTKDRRREETRGQERARGAEHMSFAVPRGATGFDAWDSYIKREAPAKTRRCGEEDKKGRREWRKTVVGGETRTEAAGAAIGSARRTAAKRTRDR